MRKLAFLLLFFAAPVFAQLGPPITVGPTMIPVYAPFTGATVTFVQTAGVSTIYTIFTVGRAVIAQKAAGSTYTFSPAPALLFQQGQPVGFVSIPRGTATFRATAVNTGGGTITGSGVAGEVTIWDGVTSIAGYPNLLYTNATKTFSNTGTVQSTTYAYFGSPLTSFSTVGKGNIDGIGSPVIIAAFNTVGESQSALSTAMEDDTADGNIATQFNTLTLSGTHARTGLAANHYAQQFIQGSTNTNIIAAYYNESLSAGVLTPYSGTLGLFAGFYTEGVQTGGMFSGTISKQAGQFCAATMAVGASVINACLYSADFGSNATDYGIYEEGTTLNNLFTKATYKGPVTFNGSSSGSASIGVAAMAGTPCTIVLPITDPTAGYVLSAAAPSAGSCQLSWISPGAGGSVTSVATTAPITGGTFTTTGTIACATCTTASSPGAGIGHFAGSTQALTSSAVNLASEVTGQLPIGSVGSAGLSGTSPMAVASTGVVSCATCVVASSPGAGLAHFAGSTQTVTSSAVVGADMTNNTVTATQLAAQYSKLRCETGLGDGLNAIAAATYLQTNCYNDSGVTWTITRLGCFTDNSGTSTLSATNGANTALLTGAVTCTTAAGGAAGTQSATVTIANGDVIKFTFIADGTSKQSGWFVSMTQ